jgi:hypothetical protein
METCRRLIASTIATVLGICALWGLGTGRACAADDPLAPARFWGDFGVGYGYLNMSGGPPASSDSGAWIELTAGGRLGEHWLLGVNVGAIGTQLANKYYDPNIPGSSTYGQTVNQALLLAEYTPSSGRGWTFGAGAGLTDYHNHVLQQQSGSYNNGSGTGGMLRLGHDWPLGPHSHFETRLSVAAGSINLSAPASGSRSYSLIVLSVHGAYH